MYCTNCGKKLYEGDRFCAHCGTKVREEAPVPKPVSHDIVFNPPFKVEADRRTSEIYRGFVSERPAEEKKRPAEPVNFDWNLSGFPQETRKTEDVNFNWDSVVERRNQQKRDALKVEEHFPAPLPVVDKIDIRGMQEPEPELRVRTPLFVEPEVTAAPAAEEEIPAAEIEIPDLVLPEKLAEEVPDAEPEEKPMTAEELEQELFGDSYRGIGAMAPEEAVKNTAQLEKFYTYNKKNEEFQQLLDQEYERLRDMEDARRPDTESLEFTWAATLFPEPAHGESSHEEPVKEDAAKAAPETAAAEPAAVPSDTLDFTAIREEARQKKLQEAAAEPEETPAEAESEEEPKPEALGEAEASPSTAESGQEAEPGSEPEPEPEHDEKAKLRYSDVFPRESVADHSDADRPASAVTAAKITEVFDEDEDDEPKKMNFFVKLIIFILVVLILAEGVILLAKFIAPDSAFSQKADAMVESIMDRITGGDGSMDGDGEDAEGSDPVSGSLTETTYISDLLAEEIELPDSIGEVLEDAGLKYDLEREYAFEELADTSRFENGDWLTDQDGENVTYAEGILDAVVGYYGQWQATNRDTSLIGINKLEIGEIRTGEKGYYVLCRLTFAAVDGEEVEEYVTACVKISQNSMLLNEIKEEKL